MGKITLDSNHILHRSGGSQNTSAYMQNHLCYIGQELVFSEGSAAIKRLLLIDINPKSIERNCHYYGSLLETQQQQAITLGAGKQLIKIPEMHYVMLDGGMVFTREEGWKEMKLGRVFKGADIITVNKNRHEITNSQYVAHLGSHHLFLEKLEHELLPITNKTIIADGATWIWNWANASYPEATQILDFYHAKEHLCDYAQVQFKEQAEKHKWIDEQCLLLLNDKVSDVIQNIKEQKTITKTKQQKQSLLTYYTNNSKRMKYKPYRDEGLLIGSGPIESAHRNVIQKRMKLSGQRWTIEGAQQLANLRVLNKSNQWGSLEKLIKMAA